MRLEWQEWENSHLAPGAVKSSVGGRRDMPEEECAIRTCFQRDRDRILHSKAFRRLKHKTQVFFAVKGDHFRTRLTHTLEVAQISRTISRALRLNEDLTEAIALGHDLGHTPFGHAGERHLNRLAPAGFSHNEQSLRVVEILEKDGAGLNLTAEVKDGILYHSGVKGRPFTLEGGVVRLSDRIAYINHDIDDALRAGIFSPADMPAAAIKLLGNRHSLRINAMVMDIIENSAAGEVSMSSSTAEAADELREYLFKTVYFRPAALEEEIRLGRVIEDLYNYYTRSEHKLPFSALGGDYTRAVIDYIAGMTDQYALAEHSRIFAG